MIRETFKFTLIISQLQRDYKQIAADFPLFREFRRALS